jgi:hypothetical protein
MENKKGNIKEENNEAKEWDGKIRNAACSIELFFSWYNVPGSL